jgi:hypothetical protein
MDRSACSDTVIPVSATILVQMSRTVACLHSSACDVNHCTTATVCGMFSRVLLTFDIFVPFENHPLTTQQRTIRRICVYSFAARAAGPDSRGRPGRRRGPFRYVAISLRVMIHARPSLAFV